MSKRKTTYGGARRTAGRPPHPLGTGVKVTVMIPCTLLDQIDADAIADDRFRSQEIVARLMRGRKRGRV